MENCLVFSGLLQMLEIRRATIDDARMIAEIHLASWRAAYADLIAAETLATLDIEERTRSWVEALGSAPGRPDWAAFLATNCDGDGVGFAAGGLARDARLITDGYIGEIFAIYVLDKAQRGGAGTGLMRALGGHFVQREIANVAVCVFRDNPPGRRFYEALGARRTGLDDELDWLNQKTPYVAYGWRGIRSLCGAEGDKA